MVVMGLLENLSWPQEILKVSIRAGQNILLAITCFCLTLELIIFIKMNLKQDKKVSALPFIPLKKLKQHTHDSPELWVCCFRTPINQHQI
jgi:hypothetical protein